jgi:hypothetical protein
MGLPISLSLSNSPTKILHYKKAIEIEVDRRKYKEVGHATEMK